MGAHRAISTPAGFHGELREVGLRNGSLRSLLHGVGCGAAGFGACFDTLAILKPIIPAARDSITSTYNSSKPHAQALRATGGGAEVCIPDSTDIRAPASPGMPPPRPPQSFSDMSLKARDASSLLSFTLSVFPGGAPAVASRRRRSPLPGSRSSTVV